MKSELFVIDPGQSTGVAAFRYSDSEPAQVEGAWQISGGILGFLNWYRKAGSPLLRNRTLVVEKFTPRQALKLEAAEPLVIEGALIALGLVEPYQVGGKNPQWQHPSQMYFAGGKTLAEKKKRAHAWLKSKAEHGLYVTGKDVGQKDADDARSALLHGVVWFRTQRHMPTLKALFHEEEE